MSENSKRRSEEFLKISGQFKLGALVTESSHPVTAGLGEVAKQDIAAALKLLFDVDDDVVRKYREFVESGRAGEIKETVLHSLKNGGRIFFTGCGSTGRLGILLDSIWRDFWQQQRNVNFKNRTFSVMAGGDFTLIKSIEGFEDFTAFGKKQMDDLGVSDRDVVFAITEGGETSFVIGTAWAGVEVGAKVYFIYNNPDEILCEHVGRSREVIQEPRIEKINLTTGPMAIMGSTRMQATSIQLCVMLTILEMVVRDLLELESAEVPKIFLAKLAEMHASLKSPELLAQLAQLVALEESVYRSGHKNNYFAGHFGIDVLTDTTERSPTYCTPPFRKFDDPAAAESWAFLFMPQTETLKAWKNILKREPRCVGWSESEIRGLVGGEKFSLTVETIRKISCAELMRFRIGQDGLPQRALKTGDSAVVVLSRPEKNSLLAADGFYHTHLETARKAGARTGVIHFGTRNSINEIYGSIARWDSACTPVCVLLPETDLLLDGVTRVMVKLLLNALSTCTMVRLGRVMGNAMIWVVPSNLKLIDRATRYIGTLTGLTYGEANQLLFEVIEYVEPRMKLDQAYPPVVGMAVMRARYNLSNAETERKLQAEL
jgi:N-acetylmuramic acid 6-phosphate etherase